MIRIPDNWLTLTLALTDAEKGRLLDALAALVNGADPEEWLDGPERILFPVLSDGQRKSKSVKDKSKFGQSEGQNSDKDESDDGQRKSKFGKTEVKREEESEEREKKERTKERREKEEREEKSVSSPPTLTADCLTDFSPDARAREDDAADGGESESQSVSSRIVEVWNNTPGLIGVRLTPRRLQQIEDLRKSFSDQTILSVFSEIRDKPFLLGKNNTGWIVLWNWIVNPNNFIRVLEGDFDSPVRQTASPPSYDIDRAMDRMRTTVPALTKKRR